MPAEKHKDIRDYIAALPEGSRSIAEAIRQSIRTAAPGCVEDIKYGIPAFKIGGKSVVYFAVWKKHVGLYPIYRGSDHFEAEIAPFRAKKDTVQFSLSKPIPYDLITKIVESQTFGLLPNRDTA